MGDISGDIDDNDDDNDKDDGNDDVVFGDMFVHSYDIRWDNAKFTVWDECIVVY